MFRPGSLSNNVESNKMGRGHFETNDESNAKVGRKRKTDFDETHRKSKIQKEDSDGVYFAAGRESKKAYEDNYYINGSASDSTFKTANEAGVKNDEMIDYLTRVNDSLKRKRDEDIAPLLSDLLSTIEGDEVRIIEDVRTNPILRKIVLKCNTEQLLCFVRAFTSAEQNFEYIANGKESAAFLENCFKIILDKLRQENKRLWELPDLKESIYKLIEMIAVTSVDKFLCNIKAIHLVKKLFLLVMGELDKKNYTNQGLCRLFNKNTSFRNL